MPSKPTPSRTINPIHFEDLEPHRFEDLVRQLAYNYRHWQTIEATGRLGGDDGIDIRATELLVVNPDAYLDETEEQDTPEIDERIWVFQCKRYQRIGPTLIETIVNEAIPKGANVPFGLIVAAACDMSKRTMDAFRKAARAHGVQEFDLWTKGRIEDLLFQPKNDHLLFAYFGISISSTRRSNLTAIRKRISIKRKLRRALGDEEFGHLLRENVLIRDIVDEEYPYEPEDGQFVRDSCPPWHMTRAKLIHVRGLIVCRYSFMGWVKEDGTWDMADSEPNLIPYILDHDMPEEFRLSREKRAFMQERTTLIKKHVPDAEYAEINVWEAIIFENILEVDPDGDSMYKVPHIYCVFGQTFGPYSDRKNYVAYSHERSVHPERLEPDKRIPLFKNNR